MRNSDSDGAGGGIPRSRAFTLYVEGPRDRDILRRWAHRVSPRLARGLARSSVILGGRQPARAIELFRSQGGGTGGASALCVLDRDFVPPSQSELGGDPGLEFFTWSRRHIESYLLVPDAIRRALRLRHDDTVVDRLFREHVPSGDDEEALADLDAKRLLANRGALARQLGSELVPGRIARAMRSAEIHPEVIGLLSRVQQGLGLAEPQRHVVTRRR